MEKKETISIPGEWPLSSYTFKADKVMDRFLDGLKDKRILGIKCPGCGIIYVPPKLLCGRCHSQLRIDRAEDWVPVSDKGTVITFTVGDDTITIVVKLDGTDTIFLSSLGGIKLEDVKVGMHVQAVWAEEPRGELSDIAYFKPLD